MRATARRVRSPPDSTRTGFSMSSPEKRKPPRMVRIVRHHVDGRVSGQRLVDGQRRIEPRGLVLREVLHHHLVPFGPRPAVGRLDA